jgi:hypothetical protein
MAEDKDKLGPVIDGRPLGVIIVEALLLLGLTMGAAWLMWPLP